MTPSSDNNFMAYLMALTLISIMALSMFYGQSPSVKLQSSDGTRLEISSTP